MSDPSQAVIQEMFDAYGKGDASRLESIVAADVIYHLPGRTIGGEYRGRRAVFDLWERQKAHMGGRVYKVGVLETLAAGDKVVTLIAGTAESSGRSLAWRGINFYRVSDGQVAECRVFIDDLYSFDDFWAGIPASAHS